MLRLRETNREINKKNKELLEKIETLEGRIDLHIEEAKQIP